MRQQTVPVLAFVVILIVGPVAATVPTAASATASPTGPTATGPSVATAQAPVDASDEQYNDTAFLALADAGGDAVVAGGLTGVERPNATIQRIGPDGDAEWTIDFERENATRVTDVVVADNGDVYFLLVETPSAPMAGSRTGDVQLARATADGDLTWQTSLDAPGGYAGAATLAASDDGVAVAHSLGRDGGVRLAEYHGGDATWEQTYGVGGQPTELRMTDDGYLLAGTDSFEPPWVLRTGMSGQERLNATVPGIEANQVVGALPTDDGGAVLAGSGSPGIGTNAAGWAARVDGDGLTRWSRVYGVDGDVRVTEAFEHDGGLLLVGQGQSLATGDGTTQLLGIGTDGDQRFAEEVEAPPWFTATTRTGDSLRIAGVADPVRGGYNATLTTVAVPDGTDADGGLDADVGVTANETVYRGQNIELTDAAGADDAYDLVRLPAGEDASEPQVVRRIALDDDGSAVVETATLERGEYVLRTTDGRNVSVDDGRITGVAEDGEPAAFTLRRQHFFGVDANRTFVDAAAGERDVSFEMPSDRTDYDVYVGADRFRGDAATAEDLRAAFGDVPGFAGVEQVNGQSVARIAVGDRERLNASVGALDAGLYDLRIASVDTRDAGASATTRVVVGNDSGDQLGVELANETLSLAVGGESETNVTLTNVTNGVAALSLSANRTGDPAIGLRLSTSIGGNRASGSAGWSNNEATAGATEFGGDTANGTVRVGSLSAQGDTFSLDENASGTNTVTFGVDWAVDEDGVPYAVPDDVTVTVDVSPAENATGGTGEGSDGGHASGGESTSGSSESDSDETSDTESGSASESRSSSA